MHRSIKLLEKFAQNVQRFGWMLDNRPHQFVRYLSRKHEVTVLSINDWWKEKKNIESAEKVTVTTDMLLVMLDRLLLTT